MGLALSSIILYAFLFFSLNGPSLYSTYVLYGIFLAYFISYVFSLFEFNSRFLKFLILIICVLGLTNSLIYSVLVTISKASYPYFFTARVCYIDFLFFAFLVFKWNKVK